MVTQLYKTLGEPVFDHDFEHVAYEARAFDDALGTPGLHEVQGRVEWRPRPTVLPPDLFERFVDDSFWRKPQPRLAQLPSILWHADTEGATEGQGPMSRCSTRRPPGAPRQLMSSMRDR